MEKMVNNLFSIYKNKNILITGHTGFKGAWLTTMLIKLGANVTGYSLKPKNKNDLFNTNELSSKINDIRGDIRDYNSLLNTIKKNNIEIIFHLAAQPLVIESYNNPKYTFETNVMGTVNILEAIKNTQSVKSALLITTDKVYSYYESDEGYIESDKLGGDDPYSASKAACELIINSYTKSFFNNNGPLIASVRAGNVIGGGDWAENRLIPDCIRALENNTQLEIRNPTSTRPWQHVLEPLTAYLEICARLFLRESSIVGAWNIGPDLKNSISVENVVKLISQDLPPLKVILLSNILNKPYEAKLLKLNISKSKENLLWKPKLSIDQSIKLTLEWYLNYSKGDTFDLTLKQIDYYNKLL